MTKESLSSLGHLAPFRQPGVDEKNLSFSAEPFLPWSTDDMLGKDGFCYLRIKISLESNFCGLFSPAFLRYN